MSTLIVYDDSVSASVRGEMVARELTARGLSTYVSMFNKVSLTDFPRFRGVVFLRPTADLRKAYAICREQGVRIAVDFDDDFISIPPEHPAFNLIGRGNPQAIHNLFFNVQNADVLTVSTPELANRFGPYHRNLRVIPNFWEDTNFRWMSQDRRTRPDMLNIGWAGSLTHKEDVKLILNTLVRITKEHPNVCIVIGADLDIYKQLAKVPERQKLFIPGLPYEEYPWMVRHFDVLLAPLRDTPFNAAKSDIKLIEAGAARIPYVASDVPCYRESINRQGGFLVRDNWYEPLKRLVEDATLRTAMGEAGWRMVQPRRISKMMEWQNLILELEGRSATKEVA